MKEVQLQEKRNVLFKNQFDEIIGKDAAGPSDSE